jgi:hypothetical protein
MGIDYQLYMYMTHEFPLRVSSATGYLSDISNAKRRASWRDESGFFAEVAKDFKQMIG